MPETIVELWPVLLAVVITPLLGYAKMYLPDIPILTFGLNIGLSVGLCYLLALWLAPGADMSKVISFALTASVAGSALHAGVKTKGKLK